MRLQTIKKDKYNLHIIKTNKFKTISIKIVFWSKLKKEELSLRNMLLNNLLFSSFNYNTNRKMAIKKQELYSSEIFGKTYRKGTQIISEINISSIEDKYTEKGNFEKSLNFLFEIINNPNVRDNKFDELSFEINKENLLSSLKQEKESPSYQCYKGFEKLIGDDKIFTGSILGTKENIEKITPENLYEYYKKFIKENNIDIYMVGRIDENIIKIIDDNLNIKGANDNEYKIYNEYEKDFSEQIKESKFNQSKLIMGASLKKLTEHEKTYEAIIYNIILGNSPTSKLFVNVREKNSFAYSISSSINKLDGLFTISAGISYKNFEQTKKEVYNQIEEMKKGKFTKKELKDAKEAVLSILKEVEDHPLSIMDYNQNINYFNADDIETKKQEIKKITKENIIELAKKINIDTIFLLKEDQNENI